MKIRRITGVISLGIIICLLALLLISACAQPATTPMPTITPKPTATTPAGPKTGGVIKAQIFTDANFLGFPGKVLFFQDIVMSKTSVEMLFRVDAKGNTVPWLVESWAEDPGAKTLTLKLKKGVKFHDGTDFNAASVKWNLESYTASGRTEIMGISSYDIVDDYTLRCNMPTYDSTVLMGLAWSAGPQISPTAWKNAPGAATDKDRDAWAAANPVGTGPFQFVSWSKSVKQVYKKFPNYWGKGQPYADGFEWHIIADPMVASASFQAKETDLMFGISPTVGKALKAAGQNIVELKSGLGVQFKGFMAQSANPKSPFTDVRLRQAVGHAVDSKALIDNIYFGFAGPVNQYSAPGSPWSNPDVKGYPFDLAKAQKLVTEAGYSASNPLKTVINTENTPDDVNVSTALQAMLAKAYIDASIKPAERGLVMQVQTGGSWEGLMYGTFRTDPEPALQFLRIIASTGVNYTKALIHPEDMEKLYPLLRSTGNIEERKKIIWQLQSLLFDKYCLFTPYFMINGLAAKQTYVKDDNFMTVKMDQFTPESAWLDK